MIHARRVAHRRIVSVLAFVVPALWGAGLLLRPEVPPLSPADRRLLAEAGFAPEPGHASPLPASIADAGEAFELRLETGAGGERLLAIRPTRVILRPDLLVYWLPDGVRAPGAGAVLLGSLSGGSPRSWRLPEAAADGSGEIAVYSLGHGEVVERVALARAGLGG